MNKDKLIDLLQSGAYFDKKEQKIFHSSFRKGWRKLTTSNISWIAVEKTHGMFGTNRIVCENNVYRLA